MQPTKVQVVLYRQLPEELDPQVLILEKTVNGHSMWGLITGFIEADETDVEAAAREAIEESGLETLSKPLPLDNSIVFKSVFTGNQECEMAFGIESLKPDEEIDLSSNPDHEHIGYRWVSPEEAYMLLPFDSFKESIRCLLQKIQA